MINYIYKYYQAISDGEIVVGKWVRLWYECIIKGLENKAFFYAPKKAERAIKFIEGFCHHHEGELAPQLVKLELWQKAFISVIFGIVDADGLRQFREVVLVIGRKNGKTLLAAGIAEYMTFLDDYGARVYFCAPKLDQARLCYSAYTQSIKSEPELDSMSKKRRTDIYVEARNASASPLAFSAKKSDGLNVSLAVMDEFGAYAGDAGLKFYEVIKSSCGARKQPMLLCISTANFINDGIFDELMKRATAVIKGTSKETRLAPFLYMIDDIEKWNDINELQKSNPNLGVSISVNYLIDEIAIAEGSLSKRAEFLTKYANVKMNSSQAFLSTQVIENAMCDELNLKDFAHSYAVAGIDLSQCLDLTSACILVEKNGKTYVFSHFWLPEEKLESATANDGLPYRLFIQQGWLSVSGQNYVDYNDVLAWFEDIVRTYEILPLIVGYDRYSSTYLIKDMEARGFHCSDVFQGYNLTPAIHELEASLKDGNLIIGNNDLLKIHLLDTAVKQDNESRRLKIVKMSRNAHIDGVAAMLCAMIVRQAEYERLGKQLKN